LVERTEYPAANLITGASVSKQSAVSAEKNASFFLNHHSDYKAKVSSLKTYQRIFREVSAAIDGAELLVDVGNGGVFDYDTDKAQHIVAVDLMFTSDFVHPLPKNAEAKLGSALELPIETASADVVLMNMLLHHLTGKDVEATRTNLKKSIAEAARVLRSGGRLVIMESCVPGWFFAFEKAVYKASVKVIERVIDHPPTLQFPPSMIREMVELEFKDVSVRNVPKGFWVMQYGWRWPSALTPAQPYLFLAHRP
jgi:SAM-dependent methyltransferase